MSFPTILRDYGLQDYVDSWHRMQRFTTERSAESADEIWITEHSPVYTLGMNGKPEHLLGKTSIPVINTDRGGQITYHGPGQLVVYPLLNLNRLNLGPRQIVGILENSVIATLRQYGIKAQSLVHAPGVYVNGKKIASIGLRIKRGFCYHGLSINNNMDLIPFQNINPCGYTGLEITQLAAYGVNIDNHELAAAIVHKIIKAIEK